MGFFSGITDTLMGTPSESESSSSSGFALLPPEIQKALTGYASDVTSKFGGGAADDAYTPLTQTGYETNALNMIERGITPDAGRLREDISMQMNPFDDFVINDINREAQGDYSVLKQAVTDAGQFGSNRQQLGANDIENTRLNMIGRLKQDQYNTALTNSLTTLSDSRARDTQLGFQGGDFVRGLDTQTKQAPINALKDYGSLVGVLPQSGGSESSASSTGAQKGLIELASGFF